MRARWLLLTLPVALAVLSPLSAAPLPGPPAPRFREAAALPVQRAPQGQPLIPDLRERAVLDSEHFQITYDAERLSKTQAEQARQLAEQAWTRCERRFGSTPEGKIRLELNPNFIGATGFASPGGQMDRGRRRPSLIGIRFGELDYLGLTPEYVVTHEVAHVFSGDLAGTPLGEGIADWGAGEYSGIPMRQWWGKALQAGGLWLDPEALFITGEFGGSPEVNALIRTAQYVESGLLVQYLIDRFGLEKFRTFAREYARARGALNSNADRRAARFPPGFQPRPGSRDPRRPPVPEEVRAVFDKQLGQSWTILQMEWLRGMDAEAPPPEPAERLVIAQKIYGAVRNYEAWLQDQQPAPSAGVQGVVREAFIKANRLVAAGEFAEARRALERAVALVERLRRPAAVA